MRTSYLFAVATVLVLLSSSTGSTSPSQPGMDARISALEAEVAALGGELARLSAEDTRVPQLEPNLDGFLHIPGIPGPSVRDGHEDEIEVSAWTWGIRNPTGAAPYTRDIAVLKDIDKASVPLFSASASGEAIPEATLSFRRTIEGETSDYLIITLQNVSIVGIEHGLGSGFELVTLSADQIVMKYDDTFVAGWDFVANAPV